MIETREYEAAEQEKMISDILAMQATFQLDRYKKSIGKEFITPTFVSGLTDKVRSALIAALPNVYDTASTNEYFPEYCKPIQELNFTLEGKTIAIEVDTPQRLSAYMHTSGFLPRIRNLAEKGARIVVTAYSGYPTNNINKINTTFSEYFPNLSVVNYKSTEGNARKRKETEAVFSLPNNFDYHR